MKSLHQALLTGQPFDQDYLLSMKFEAPSPMWDGPSVVARFAMESFRGHTQWAHIRKDDNGRFTCHCGDYKNHDRCTHVEGWVAQQQISRLFQGQVEKVEKVEYGN